jgi:hypothetical protein
VVCYDHVRVVTGIEMMIAKKKKKKKTILDHTVGGWTDFDSGYDSAFLWRSLFPASSARFQSEMGTGLHRGQKAEIRRKDSALQIFTGLSLQ